ncbi:MAG: UDP-N-acetylmuramate--L-alanine ligase [Chitinophagales bacterium]
MRIHLVAIGGAVMHNLAIALKLGGHKISGSDDEVFEPSLSRLKKHDILPQEFGWFPQKISKELDAVILGMHARADNPELLKAQEIGVPVYNFPEYVFEQSRQKTRVAICGSHGKTTITSMIMHCLKHVGKNFDYLVGAQLQGFETMVQLSEADTIIIEGDEYFASPIDRRPKFLFYQPQITLISGIAWDHFNVFPAWEEYLHQFTQLLNSLQTDATVIYNCEDENIIKAFKESTCKARRIAYATPTFTIQNGKTCIGYENSLYELTVFGRHNMQNMMGAKQVCNLLGISSEVFFKTMQTFSGAAKRLEVIRKDKSIIIFRDFAHAPSKVKATVEAVKEQYPDKQLIACLELHTFSSLNKSFIPQYKNTMQAADKRIVYFNPHTIAMKKLENISIEELKMFFNDDKLIVLNSSKDILSTIKKLKSANDAVLLMSSGNFDNLDFDVLT